MSYYRKTFVEFNSEKLVDEAQVDYSKKTLSEFSEAEIILYNRTGYNSPVVASLYTNKEISK